MGAPILDSAHLVVPFLCSPSLSSPVRQSRQQCGPTYMQADVLHMHTCIGVNLLPTRIPMHGQSPTFWPPLFSRVTSWNPVKSIDPFHQKRQDAPGKALYKSPIESSLEDFQN